VRPPPVLSTARALSALARCRVLAHLSGLLGDFDLAEEAAEIAVGGLQEYDDDE